MGNAECAPLRVRRVVQELRMVEACARRPIAARIRAALLGDAQWRVGLAARVADARAATSKLKDFVLSKR